MIFRLLIRLALDGSIEYCGVNFSQKFGCEPTTEVIELMEYIKTIGMTLLGFCFHLGSPCLDTSAYSRGIKICNDLINIAKAMGHLEARVIDIGGGIDGIDYDYFDQVIKFYVYKHLATYLLIQLNSLFYLVFYLY